jgi:hypothetical protein
MFFQEITPDTSGYMIAGFAVAFIVMALYVASIYLRRRNLDQDMSMLQELDKPVPPAQTAARQPQKRAAKSGGRKSSKSVIKKSGKK